LYFSAVQLKHLKRCYTLFAFGGPLFSTTALPVLVNHYAKEAQMFGMAAATATIMVMILLVLSRVYFILYDRAEETLY